MQQTPSQSPEPSDPEQETIVRDEEECLERVVRHLAEAETRPRRQDIDYDTQMLALRDEIAASRLEDIPPLLEQMERLQGLAARQRETVTGRVDPRSPYFGRMVLKEDSRVREVLIGRSTYVDSKANIRVVDWRDAPVSRIYYRYQEGEEYEETFGERDVEGEVLKRRSLSIVGGRLRRIVCPQGMFVRAHSGQWRRGGRGTRLTGGQGTASRADQIHRPKKLGLGAEGVVEEDKHLKEITALIDPRQFDLITAADSGLVVIQGGAGSGKTTIGLHRLAYLAYQDRRRFRPDRMLVIVFNDALARYIAQVLPALEVEGVAVRTFEAWASKLRTSAAPLLPKEYTDDTPTEVTRIKKHPAMLTAIDRYADDLALKHRDQLSAAIDRNHPEEWRRAVVRAFDKSRGRPLAHRLHHIKSWLDKDETARQMSKFARHGIERAVTAGLREVRDVVTAWSELLTDTQALLGAFEQHSPGDVSADGMARFVDWCTSRCMIALTAVEQQRDREHKPRRDGKKAGRGPRDEDEETRTEGIDGVALEDIPALDREDDAILLRLCQRLRGPLMRGSGKEALVYEHVLVDEAQDLSPLELAVVLDTVSKGQSVTLAGDVAQRLYMNNGFSDWKTVLAELGFSHVEIEPLKLSYRSTHEILDFARAVLGPLADDEPPEATRHGAPIELFNFSHSGDAVGFLSEALRELAQDEPLASVAVIARYPEQADMYYDGLKKAETPYLRRIAEQDFPFKPGIDVTDVRQVKGLEFDYVVLVEVTESSYGLDNEARHLLHIGATRAAHQLWILATDKPSRLIPEALRQEAD